MPCVLMGRLGKTHIVPSFVVALNLNIHVYYVCVQYLTSLGVQALARHNAFATASPSR